DLQKCIYGVHERLEYMLLQALSTGVTMITNEGDDKNNVGAGIRVDFKIPEANFFDVTTLWSDVDSKPLDDIQAVLDKAEEDGNVITKVKMDPTTFNNFKKTNQVKEGYAFSVGFVGDKISTPSLKKVNEFLLEDKGFEIQIINKTVKIERNGKKTVMRPWSPGKVTFLTSDNVGSLTYGDLAEKNHGAKEVTYAEASTFILTSKWSTTEPLKEWSKSQANVIPVLENVDQIYILDTKQVKTS